MSDYIGIDFHKQFSAVAVMDEKGKIIDERKLFHDQKDDLMAYFSQFNRSTRFFSDSVLKSKG